MLAERGVVRTDITSSLAGSSGTGQGVPLTIDLTILDGAAGGAPLEADGRRSFTSIWPGTRAAGPHPLPGRPEHRRRHRARLEARDLADRPPGRRLRAGPRLRGRRGSAQNLAGPSLDTDVVLGDGDSTRLGTAGGSPSAGTTVALNVGV